MERAFPRRRPPAGTAGDLRDPDSAIDFTPARFADGVTYALRGTALHRPPLEKLEKTEDSALWPKIGRTAPADGESNHGNLRTHPQGLSGGALWPVESVNLFNTLLERPESSGGTIESIALSPTGGDAAQKAAFLGGIVTIISETRNGHVERQKVEVLGRIGAFWHRAKHVVVYERTVNASAQFAPKRDEDKHHTRSRRPILRKVSEYIELLDCERAYPDFAGVAPRCTGFLERMRFNSRIINVDSAWSSEVGDYGWKIPLWNLLSARERPQVYPMPDIAFVSLAEGDGDKPVVSQECLDTDNLFFFADFRAGTSNTNDWVSRLDVDYCNMPAAKAIAAHADAKSAKPDDGGRRRAVSRVLPGMRRFTWRLAPAAQKTAINAGRAGKPVYVGLDSVSFMRAAPVAEGGAAIPEAWSTLLKKAADVPQTGDAIKALEDLPYWGAAGGNDFPAAVSYSKAIAQLANELNSKNKTGIEAALDALEALWKTENLPGQLKNKLEGVAKNAGTIVNDLPSFPEITKDDKFCDRLKSDTVGMIRRKEMLICTALSDWVANIEENFSEIGPGDPASGLTKKKAAINALADSIISHLRPIFADASADIGNAGEGAEKAKAVIAATEAEIEAVFARARQRVEQFSAGYDREKPWSAERRKSFHAGLRGCVANIAADIAAAIGEARQRLAVELNGVSQGVAGHLSKALTAISQFAEEALADITSVQKELGKLVAPLRKVIDDLSPEAGGGILDTCIAKIATAQAAIDAESGIADPLRQQATSMLKALTDAVVQAKTLLGETRGLLTKIGSLNEDTLGELREAVTGLAANAKSLVQTLGGKANDLVQLAGDFTDAGFDAISIVVGDVWTGVDDHLNVLSNGLDGKLLKIGEPVDFLVSSALQQIETVDIALIAKMRAAHAAIASVIDDIGTALSTVQEALGPQQLLETVIRRNIIEPSLETLLSPLNDDLSEATDPLKAVHDRLTELSATAGALIRNVSVGALGALDQVSAVCGAVFEGTETTRKYFEQLAGDFEKYADAKLAAYQPLVDRIRAGLTDLDKEAAGLITAIRVFDHSVRGLQNDLSRSAETARMYGDRVFDAFSRLDDGGTKALPSNALKLYSAVSSAPELAALKADIDRIRSGFDELSETIDTTETSALFNRLGDELKALGLDMPFDKIGDRLLLKDLKFGNFGGLNFEHLFKGQPIPASVRDAVRVSHDFDKAQARAWVQIDIDARMPGRWTLFSLGVFQVDFVDMHLTGRVRLEASKDQDTVTQTGFSRIGTTIDVVVAGQSMVKFEQFGLNFTREKGLEVEFDPKNIRLNPSFKFIQDFLSTLFPDAAGGLKIVKQDNIPVGVEHAFVIPPMTLNFGTSGVSNISIENHFKLLAFPDFMIANRFNLSSMERPFIFSIFVIGGTGYVQIDAEYRPFDSQLMVSVEAGAGGSAALAFAVGPFAGQVFITLSGVMTYRKMIGKPGGGLSLAVVLVIAGHVEVCGIVSVGITLTLRMSYRDNGEVDGRGSLAVTIRISQFFKISAHANVNYKLRGGKSETSVSSGVSGEITDEKLKDKIGKAEQAVEQLRKASN
ncbi:hypothetical protein OIU34_28230 [Pararhizobium sp. BT-229]|uniref:hypothetical protein n=1 Tax=Pararhizobium sp. BT-229 TaxID=2986923 RepID=UPI0021F7A2D3|nr:hypothetical protein [Pararhizobium sp. BT-229]MCV9965763.1 hypothetical protein [Pararhizobium sp. BT-229]